MGKKAFMLRCVLACDYCDKQFINDNADRCKTLLKIHIKNHHRGQQLPNLSDYQSFMLSRQADEVMLNDWLRQTQSIQLQR